MWDTTLYVNFSKDWDFIYFTCAYLVYEKSMKCEEVKGMGLIGGIINVIGGSHKFGVLG